MKKDKYLVDGPITPGIISGYLEELGERKNCGAHSVFMGQVRDDDIDGQKVVAIEYSAYDNMVEAEASRIIDNTRNAFSDIQDISILHSTGVVRSGEISLFILVTAGHRDQAVRGCRHILELIKENWPVWKKELFEDASHRWKEN